MNEDGMVMADARPRLQPLPMPTGPDWCEVVPGALFSGL